MIYLESKEKEEILQIVDKLLIQFLKKNKLMHRLYDNCLYYKRKYGRPLNPLLARRGKTISFSHLLNRISWHFLECAKDIEYYQCNRELGFSTEDLVLSQFWRFYILENLHLFPTLKIQNEIDFFLRERLRDNYIGRNKELQKLVVKWKILS